jgi:hypothetical protein
VYAFFFISCDSFARDGLYIGELSIGNHCPLKVDCCTADVNDTVPDFVVLTDEEVTSEEDDCPPQLYTK